MVYGRAMRRVPPLLALLILVTMGGASMARADALHTCKGALRANAATSCEFAAAVFEAYESKVDTTGDTAAKVRAHSSVTGLDYTVYCQPTTVAATVISCGTSDGAALIRFNGAGSTSPTPRAQPAVRQPSVAATTSPATVTERDSGVSSSAYVIAAVAAWLLLWVLPSVLVAVHASRNGFRFGSYLTVALFLSWPVALFADVLFGDRSPLVNRRNVPTASQAVPERREPASVG